MKSKKFGINCLRNNHLIRNEMEEGIMRRKGVVLFCILLVMVCFITAYGRSIKVNNQTVDTSGKVKDVAPRSEVKGYYSAQQKLQGGIESDNVNLKKIDVKQTGTDVTLIFSFMNGSEKLGTKETKVDHIPFFLTSFVENPYRFMLRLEGLTYWDFDQEAITQALQKTPFFQGMFQQLPMDNNSTILYFHTSSPLVYKVEEKKDQLVLTIHPIKGQPKSGYYIILNAFDLYQQGMLPKDAGLLPALCTDKQNVTMLSSMINSKTEADKQMEKLVGMLKSRNVDRLPKGVQLGANQYPTYDAQADVEGARNKNMIRVAGKPYPLPVLVEGGRFLTWAPDGKSYIYAKPIVQAIKDQQEVSTINEEIWISDEKGEKKRLQDNEFSTILQAQYSPDGTKLLLLEQMEEMWVLYLYDSKTNELTNMAEEGFGSSTKSFTWSTDGTKVYAMSGEDVPQLLEYDIHQPSGSRVRTLEEKAGTAGDLSFVNGKIYFSDEAAGTVGKIYEMDPSAGKRSDYANGASFKISPDGKKMAIVEIQSVKEEEFQTVLKIRDLASGSEQVIPTKKVVLYYSWTIDSSNLFYTIDMAVDEKETYATELWKYHASDAVNTMICDLSSSEFYSSNKNNEVLLMDLYVTKGNDVPVTYRLDITKIGK